MPKQTGSIERFGVDRPIHGIGDVHARSDLLAWLLAEIPADEAVVFLGDYVNRGPDPLGSLRLVHDTVMERRRRGVPAVALPGNHEDVLLAWTLGAKRGRARAFARFLRHGGAETMARMGYVFDDPDRPEREMEAAADYLKGAVGDLLEWLESLPTLAMAEGPLAEEKLGAVFVHAGFEPGVPLGEQDRETLLWTRSRRFLRRLELPMFVVHGHTPAREPQRAGSRINVDTGAHKHGRLTAVRLCRDRVVFTGVAEDGSVKVVDATRPVMVDPDAGSLDLAAGPAPAGDTLRDAA